MKTNRKLFFFAAVLFSGFLLNSCQQKTPESFKVVFYNVENLFDTINDEGVRDGGFTPEGKIVWDGEKYTKKLNDLAKVISAIDSINLPVIIGLSEVENLGVLKDLTTKTRLSEGDYDIIHFDSPDERGIDVALLYRRGLFSPLHARPYPLTFNFDKDDKTRDMLYVKGVAGNKDTLHIMVNHWPSRSGGKEKSDPKRKAAAESVRSVADSILRFNANANIIIMGDLNDNPTDANVLKTLNAKRLSESIDPGSLYNLSIRRFENGEGTLYWRSWDLFDQMIVSGNILEGENNFKLTSKDIGIFKKDWMLYERRDGTKVPNRTAGRSDYYGGYSDHLPVFIEFELKDH